MLGKLLRFLTGLFSGTPGDSTVLLVRTVYAPDGRHRVCFFHRKEDGVHGFREEVYDDKGMEAHWVPMKHGHVEEYGSMDEALAAARAGVPWLHGAE